eukprot:scaffold4023_cov31-Tisochrysis_lutea.AAC.4
MCHAQACGVRASASRAYHRAGAAPSRSAAAMSALLHHLRRAWPEEGCCSAQRRAADRGSRGAQGARGRRRQRAAAGRPSTQQCLAVPVSRRPAWLGRFFPV